MRNWFAAESTKGWKWKLILLPSCDSIYDDDDDAMMHNGRAGHSWSWRCGRRFIEAEASSFWILTPILTPHGLHMVISRCRESCFQNKGFAIHRRSCDRWTYSFHKLSWALLMFSPQRKAKQLVVKCATVASFQKASISWSAKAATWSTFWVMTQQSYIYSWRPLFFACVNFLESFIFHVCFYS